MKRYTEEQIEEARNTDLYDYLVSNHAEDFKVARDCLRLEENHTVYIHRGKNFWIDWADNSGGNAVDFLMKFYGYSFPGAVKELLEGDGVKRVLVAQGRDDEYEEVVVPHEFVAPEKGTTNRNVYAYLTKTRRISGTTINNLIKAGLLYQDIHRNAVFINAERDRCEIVGTCTFVDKYKRTRLTAKDRFWYFIPDVAKDVKIAYVTEGAIDAVSLYELRNHENAMYASIPGVNNQAIIDRIKSDDNYKLVLAVDNDDSGQKCRDRNPGLEYLIPPDPYKDWNEMLQTRTAEKTA